MTQDNDDKIKHLQMIQDVVKRMADTSAAMKRYALVAFDRPSGQIYGSSTSLPSEPASAVWSPALVVRITESLGAVSANTASPRFRQ